jgi:hypothetical protein
MEGRDETERDRCSRAVVVMFLLLLGEAIPATGGDREPILRRRVTRPENQVDRVKDDVDALENSRWYVRVVLEEHDERLDALEGI